MGGQATQYNPSSVHTGQSLATIYTLKNATIAWKRKLVSGAMASQLVKSRGSNNGGQSEEHPRGVCGDERTSDAVTEALYDAALRLPASVQFALGPDPRDGGAYCCRAHQHVCE